MPNDPIREKFEQAFRDLKWDDAHLAYDDIRERYENAIIDRLLEMFRAGRASVIAEMRPAAWQDPSTEDVITDARKADWLAHYGYGGARKVAAYTTPLSLIPKE